MNNKRKEYKLKAFIVFIILCLPMLFSVSVFAGNKSELKLFTTPYFHDASPFIYDWDNKEYVLTVEKGTEVKLMHYIGYYKNGSGSSGIRLDKVKGKKKCFIENPEIATLTKSGTLKAVGKGKTNAVISCKGKDFKFSVSVTDEKISGNKKIRKLRKSIAAFNKGISSGKSFTQKNRVKKLKQLSAVLMMENRLKGNGTDLDAYNGGLYKGVCVVPDYCVFAQKVEWFDDYCASLDPTWAKGDMQFIPTGVYYEGGKIVIRLNSTITQDQIFGFKTHSYQREELHDLSGDDQKYIQYGYFTDDNSEFDKAGAHIFFYKEGDEVRRYYGRGMINAGDDRIVLTPFVAENCEAKYYESGLDAGKYCFVLESEASLDEKWLMNLSFNVQ